MQSVMISIQPKWCELIASGRKTIEVRKTRPQLETPFKCYIYCTSRKIKAIENPNAVHVKLNLPKHAPIKRVSYVYPWYQKVIGEFVCDFIEFLKYYRGGYSSEGGYSDSWHEWKNEDIDYEDMCLSERELEDYLGTYDGYGWHISDLKIYDTPKELSEFYSTAYQKNCKPCDALCEYYPNCELKKNRKPLARAPQSWCYVEEVTE